MHRGHEAFRRHPGRGRENHRAPGGTLVIYGPFKRDGQLTSDGDQRFDAELRGADPQIGYKDDTQVAEALARAGLSLAEMVDMPANNLALVATRT